MTNAITKAAVRSTGPPCYLQEFPTLGLPGRDGRQHLRRAGVSNSFVGDQRACRRGTAPGPYLGAATTFPRVRAVGMLAVRATAEQRRRAMCVRPRVLASSRVRHAGGSVRHAPLSLALSLSLSLSIGCPLR